MTMIAVYSPKNPNKTDTLVLDAVLTEEHALENTVTEYPREDGSALNDHIVNKPRRLTIQGMVTEAPVRHLPELQKLSRSSRLAEAFLALERLHTKREPVSVLTRLKQYDNMAIERISIPRAAATGRALEFTLSLVQIHTAASKTVKFESKAASDGGQATANAGKQTPAETAPGAANNIPVA